MARVRAPSLWDTALLVFPLLRMVYVVACVHECVSRACSRRLRPPIDVVGACLRVFVRCGMLRAKMKKSVFIDRFLCLLRWVCACYKRFRSHTGATLSFCPVWVIPIQPDLFFR